MLISYLRTDDPDDLPETYRTNRAKNADEVWTQLQDPKTYVFVAGLKQIGELLDEALVNLVGSPAAYPRQKAKMIDEGRWAELIYYELGSLSGWRRSRGV